ncbi:hypothetical protein NSTC745_03875 [Nostoc sp. DSM 114161]|jgi:hypothetical protein
MSYPIISLTDLFGDGAVQTSTTLTIKKSDLITLTPFINNSAESLLVAILVRAATFFQAFLADENGNPIITEEGYPIGYDRTNLYELLNVFIWESKYTSRDDINLSIKDTIVCESYTDLPDWE